MVADLLGRGLGVGGVHAALGVGDGGLGLLEPVSGPVQLLGERDDLRSLASICA